MAIFTKNFSCVEQRSLAVTATSGTSAFTTTEAIAAEDVMVENEGPNGCQLIFGTTTAQAAAGAQGTRQFRIPAGAVLTINKGSGIATFAAICEATQTAALTLHAGNGN